MLPRLRRFRRRLLLPLGWVALGCLLPLSCWLLGRQPKQWRQENVVQLTMPPLRPDTSKWSRDLFAKQRAYEQLCSPRSNGTQSLPAVVAHLRLWGHFELPGNVGQEAKQLARIEAIIKAMQADTEYAGGVRIELGPQATYRELVALLEMMSRLDQKRYWLSITHRPTAFYAITLPPPTLAERQKAGLTFLCCGTHHDVYQPFVPATALENFRQPARRPQLLLTLATAALLLASLAGTLTLALGTRR